MKYKDKKMLFGIGIVFLFLATVGFSYAYFTATLVNKDVKDQVVETGTLRLTYTDGPEIKMLNIKPGTTFTKEVSVKNTGTLDTTYNLVWQELANEITNDEMVMSATCERRNADGEVEESCEGLSETAIGANIIKKNIAIESGVTHKYVITITFKDTDAEQNYNQNKKFSGVLGVNEYKVNTPQAIYCTFDGELTQGAEYVNGQYTYRYMQEGKFPDCPYSQGCEIAWSDITDDGWGVQLTNRNSTDPINDDVCTYINDKPVVSSKIMYAFTKATTIDMKSFNTSNITNMSMMFASLSLDALDFSNFNTKKVKNMNSMFAAAKINLLDLSSFDTSNVTDMSEMFTSSSVNTLKLDNFDTSNVTDMHDMFWHFTTSTLNLKMFNTKNVKDMHRMFADTNISLLEGLDNFNTVNVTNMTSMFGTTSFSTLDLSNFDTSNVTDMNGMFRDNEKLATIYTSNKFVTESIIDDGDMFTDCTSLVGGAGTTYDASHVDKTYARIDGGTSSPGYFTLKTN